MSTEELNLPNEVEQLRALIARRDAEVAAQSVALAEHRSVIERQETTITANIELIQRHATIDAEKTAIIEKQLNGRAGTATRTSASQAVRSAEGTYRSRSVDAVQFGRTHKAGRRTAAGHGRFCIDG